MPDERSDAQVIADSFERPREFAPIFDRHFDTVHRYLSRRLGPDLGQELTAQTFEQALRSRARFDLAQPSARPWLLGIATNIARHHVRSENRRLLAYKRLDRDVASSDDAASIDGRVDAAALAPQLRAALAEVPSGERDVLLLVAWADLTYAELAAALGIPVGTVRSRLSRGRRRLRERLERSGQYISDGTRRGLVNADG